MSKQKSFALKRKSSFENLNPSFKGKENQIFKEKISSFKREKKKKSAQFKPQYCVYSF